MVNAVVYKIQCLDCAGVCIGETGRLFKTRRKDHQTYNCQQTNEDLKKKSAQVKHVCLKGHRIDRESSEIFAMESDFKKNGFYNHFMYTKLILLLTTVVCV